MIEKKGRFILLLLAIGISTGLFIGSQQATKTAVEMNTNMQLASFEGRVIGITSKESETKLEPKKIDTKAFAEVVPELALTNLKLTNKEGVTISLKGRDTSDFPTNLTTVAGEVDGLKENQVIISERVSKLLKLPLNSSLEVKLNDETKSFIIKGIVKNDGLFYNDLKTHFAVLTSYQGLSDISGLSYNIVMAGPKSAAVDQAIKKFNQANPKYVASLMIDNQQIEQISAQITVIFTFLFLFVALMSMLIISGAFKLIITERLKTLGTFLSQGATWVQLRLILLIESLCYGLLGGCMGLIIGYGIIYLVNYGASPLREFNIFDRPEVSFGMIFMGFSFACVLSVLSVLLPLFRLDRLSVKEVILNEPSYETQQGWGHVVAGGGLLFITSVLAYTKIAQSLIYIAVILGFIGFILCYPKLVESLLTIAFGRLKNSMGIIALAMQNVGTSRMIRSNITLTAIAIIVVVMINSIGVSLRGLLTESYEGYKFDLSIAVPYNQAGTKEALLKKVRDSKEIKEKSDVAHNQIMTTAKVSEQTSNIVAVNDVDAYRDYFTYIDWRGKNFDSIFRKLKEDKNTFLATKSYAKQLSLKVGQSVTFYFGAEKQTMELVGIYDNKTAFNSFIINQDSLPEVIKTRATVTYFYETTAKATIAKKQLKNTLKDYDVTIATKKEQTDQNTAQNELLITIFNVFAWMTTVIGSFGIVSNITIAFIQRKQQFALYYSLGIRQPQLISLILVEGTLITMLTFLLSFPLLMVETQLMRKVLNELIGVNFALTINYGYLPYAFILILFIVLMSSLPAMWSSRSIDIVKELKYD